MNLAVTGPHGVAAWLAWVFAIAAPLVSIGVSAVALYIADGDRRREQRERQTAELRRARMVTATLDIDVESTIGWTIGVVATVRNDADEGIQGVTVAVWSDLAAAKTPCQVLSRHFIPRHSEYADDQTEVAPAVLALNPSSPDGYALDVESIKYEIRWTDLSGQQWKRLSMADPERS